MRPTAQRARTAEQVNRGVRQAEARVVVDAVRQPRGAATFPPGTQAAARSIYIWATWETHSCTHATCSITVQKLMRALRSSSKDFRNDTTPTAVYLQSIDASMALAVAQQLRATRAARL